MSASLVGSEMCIRDRYSAARNCMILRYAALGGVILPKAVVCKVVAAREAVSYTHLTLPTICSV
eukprot:9202202-Alexandrium_andersonii.AAC.1